MLEPRSTAKRAQRLQEHPWPVYGPESGRMRVVETEELLDFARSPSPISRGLSPSPSLLSAVCTENPMTVLSHMYSQSDLTMDLTWGDHASSGLGPFTPCAPVRRSGERVAPGDEQPRLPLPLALQL